MDEQPNKTSDELEKTKTEARQGETGHRVRYVLGISFALALVVLLIILAYFA